MNKAIGAILSAVMMNAFASQGLDSDQQSVEKYRYLLTAHIKMKSPYCAFAIHEAIEHFKFDLNVKDQNGLTPMELAQKEGNLAAITYLKWREAKGTNPELAAQLSKDLTQMIDDRTKVLIAQGIVKPSNTTTTTTVSAIPEPTPPVLRSPEISGYNGPNRLAESPNKRMRNDDDDE